MIDSVMKTAKKIHVIGIGGSGIFPIVQILHEQGYVISGSDNNTGDIIDREVAMGITVTIGHDEKNLKDTDAVLYSAAISQDNPEIVEAQKRAIPLITRAEMLGYISRKFSDTISIAGTHGKTSTTAMLTQILVGAQKDPTAIIGGKLPLIDGYGRSGKSSLMVVEACEYKETYLSINTDIAVILNVDEDHLEYFKNIENIIKSFNAFARGASKLIIVNGDDPNSIKAVEGIDNKVITFGTTEQNDYFAQNIISNSPTCTSFDVFHKKENIGRFKINVPGEHNVYNAMAAVVTALHLGLSVDEIGANLEQFRGAGRRFEMLGEVNGIHIADDYAHHPREIAVTLKAASQMGFKNVWAVFQPFTYSRTALLLEDFAQALSHADNVVMSEIMAGREANTYNIFTKDLAEKISGAVWFDSFEEIADHVMHNAQAGDLVITLGCGDIYKCAKLMLRYN